jgi:hypothetical protein
MTPISDQIIDEVLKKIRHLREKQSFQSKDRKISEYTDLNPDPITVEFRYVETIVNRDIFEIDYQI